MPSHSSPELENRIMVHLDHYAIVSGAGRATWKLAESLGLDVLPERTARAMVLDALRNLERRGLITRSRRGSLTYSIRRLV